MGQNRFTFWIRRVHMYLGLLNFSILVVFGLAGLAVTLEAPDIFRQKQPPSVEFRDFAPPPSASEREVGDLLARTLAPAHAAPPVVRRDGSNRLVSEFYSVNGLVRVTLLQGERGIQIQTFRNSIWRFLDNAHATTIAEATGDRVVGAWAWYIEFSIWSLIAMSLTGLWLGLRSRWSYRWTRVALLAGTLAFAALYWMEM
jgi:hypothetical protein